MENIHSMQTRSKSNQAKSLLEIVKYKVEIDFDEASRAWRANKRHTTCGYFVYLCSYVYPGENGLRCNNRCTKNTDLCYNHRNKKI